MVVYGVLGPADVYSVRRTAYWLRRRPKTHQRTAGLGAAIRDTLDAPPRLLFKTNAFIPFPVVPYSVHRRLFAEHGILSVCIFLLPGLLPEVSPFAASNGEGREVEVIDSS